MKRNIWMIAIVCTGALLFSGCGKQAPPVQPSPSPSAAVNASPEAAPLQPEATPDAAEPSGVPPAAGGGQQEAPAKEPNHQQAPAAEPGSNPAPAAQQPEQVQPANPPAQQEAPVVEEPKQEHAAYLSVEIPSDGTTVIARTSVALEEGDTAFTILRRVAKDAGIPVASSGGSKNPYVEGINGLFEFDRGAGSGWMVSINGAFLQRGSGQIKLNAGDEVRWVYTLELGKDVGGGI